MKIPDGRIEGFLRFHRGKFHVGPSQIEIADAFIKRISRNIFQSLPDIPDGGYGIVYGDLVPPFIEQLCLLMTCFGLF